MATSRKRKATRKTATKARPAKKRSGRLIKSIITDKQVKQVKKSISVLAKDVNALEQRLNNEGAISMTEVTKIVDAAVKMQQSLSDKGE